MAGPPASKGYGAGWLGLGLGLAPPQLGESRLPWGGRRGSGELTVGNGWAFDVVCVAWC